MYNVCHITRMGLTLLDTPEELTQHIIQEHRSEYFKVLGENVHHGIQSMVACGRHPLSSLVGAAVE